MSYHPERYLSVRFEECEEMRTIVIVKNLSKVPAVTEMRERKTSWRRKSGEKKAGNTPPGKEQAKGDCLGYSQRLALGNRAIRLLG